MSVLHLTEKTLPASFSSAHSYAIGRVIAMPRRQEQGNPWLYPIAVPQRSPRPRRAAWQPQRRHECERHRISAPRFGAPSRERSHRRLHSGHDMPPQCTHVAPRPVLLIDMAAPQDPESIILPLSGLHRGRPSLALQSSYSARLTPGAFPRSSVRLLAVLAPL